MKKISVQVIGNTERITPFIDTKAVDISVLEDETSAFVSVSKELPDVIILEYNIRGNETVEYIALLNRVSPGSKIVLIADNITEEDVMRSFLAGARGYLPAQETDKYINKCIRVVDCGEAWISRKLVGQFLEMLRDHVRLKNKL